MLLDFIVACSDCGHIADEHACGGGLLEPCNIAGCPCAGYIPDADDYQRVAVDGTVSTRLALPDAEAIVGEPADAWAMRCFEIASKLADAVGGVAVYGAWTGPIADSSPFSRRPGAPNHGWVLLDDDTVFDPTRWVFEGLEPYLYEGLADFYDEGRDAQRAANLPPYPAPHGERIAIVADEAVIDLLERRTGSRAVERTAAEWLWVANLPYSQLDGCASALYAALDAVDCAAFIPIDNQLRAERDTVAG
jgi:hypothetical protein